MELSQREIVLLSIDDDTDEMPSESREHLISILNDDILNIEEAC